MPKIWLIGGWVVDPASGTLKLLADATAEPRRLEKRTMEVLIYLACNRGRVVSKRELLEAVWGRTAISENAVAIVISELRRALGDDKDDPCYIETLHKRGYRLICQAREATPKQSPKMGTPSRSFMAVLAVFILLMGLLLAWRELVQPPSGLEAAMPVAPVVLLLEGANETGLAEHDRTARTFTELLATEVEGLSDVDVHRWQESISSPVLWQEIAKIGADRSVYVLVSRVIVVDDEPQVAFGILTGAEGMMKYQTLYKDLGGDLSDETYAAISSLAEILLQDKTGGA